MLVMQKDILYSSYKMRKEWLLLQAMKYKSKDHTAKILNKLE